MTGHVVTTGVPDNLVGAGTAPRSKLRNIRAALVGAGKIAGQHLACLSNLAGVQVVGVCDLSRARAQHAAERFGVSESFTSFGTMLERCCPDVVHVTTPPGSHFPLASTALDAGAHVIVEKPAALTFGEVETLVQNALDRRLLFVENHNYVWNGATRRIRDLVNSGAFGQVMHVEAFICLDITGPASPFSDPNLPHPLIGEPGGPILDFLPHLASLAYAFVGPHSVSHASWSKRGSSHLPNDEFRALVDGETGTATLAFSANTRPDAFWLRVYGTRMQAVANLFETRLTLSQVYGGPTPFTPFRNALREAREVRRSAFGSFFGKVSGSPGSYDGLWELLARTYRAVQVGADPPISARQILSVNRLVADLVGVVH